MKNRTKSKSAFWRTMFSAFALGLVVFGAVAPAQAAPPTPAKVGQTVSTTLEANSSKDYSIPLGKGVYRIVWDAERVMAKAPTSSLNCNCSSPTAPSSTRA